jgi:hypothetical protein
MNKRIVIVAAAGLLTGLGGGTGFKVMTAPPPAEAAEGEHAAADSTAVYGEEADHAAAGAEHATDGEQLPSDDHASADSSGTDNTAAADASAATDTGADTVAAEAHDDAEADGDDEATAALGRLLGAMRPEEAARILEPLTDEQVRKVLFSLPERKAAAILAKFKGDRAAALARAIIEHAGTG